MVLRLHIACVIGAFASSEDTALLQATTLLQKQFTVGSEHIINPMLQATTLLQTQFTAGSEHITNLTFRPVEPRLLEGELERMFRESDVVYDGHLDSDEMSGFTEVYLAPALQELEKTGFTFAPLPRLPLSFAEFVKSIGPVLEASLQRSFTTFDLDQNGYLYPLEIKEFLKGFTGQRLANMLKNFDENGDGRSTFEEFVKGHSYARNENVVKVDGGSAYGIVPWDFTVNQAQLVQVINSVLDARGLRGWLPGYEMDENRACAGRNELGQMSVFKGETDEEKRRECAEKCTNSGSCIHFEVEFEGDDHTGLVKCQFSTTCTKAFSEDNSVFVSYLKK